MVGLPFGAAGHRASSDAKISRAVAGNERAVAIGAREREAGTVTSVRSGGLVRDLDLLRALAAVGIGDDGLGVMQLAAIVGRDKSQVSRAMRALESCGLVERDLRSLRYRLGVELLTLAARAGPNRLLQVAPHHLQALAEELDETVHLCTLAGTGVITIASAGAPSHGFRSRGWEGRSVPAHCTSAGRVLLLDADAAFVEQRFAAESFEDHGPRNRVRDPIRLWSEIVAARRVGFATVDEEFEPGLIGASAPVRDHHGRIVAAVNVSAAKSPEDSADPSDPSTSRRLIMLGRACAGAAAQLSRAIGFDAEAGASTGPT